MRMADFFHQEGSSCIGVGVKPAKMLAKMPQVCPPLHEFVLDHWQILHSGMYRSVSLNGREYM